MAGTKRKRPPPWGATKKQADEYSRERALKNRLHILEREAALARDDRQKLTETNVKLVEELRVARETADNAREAAESTQQSFRAAMDVSFSRGDLNAAKEEVLHVAERIVEAFARGLGGKQTS